MIISRQDFQSAIWAYIKANNLTITELARQLGKSRRGMRYWMNVGVINDEVRYKFADEYPQIFKPELSSLESKTEVEEVPSKVLTQQATVPEYQVVIKTEIAWSHASSLAVYLKWFLFEASAEDRNRFRDSLGDDWKNFLELTRAMTNEKAFEVTKNEGRLDWCHKK